MKINQLIIIALVFFIGIILFANFKQKPNAMRYQYAQYNDYGNEWIGDVIDNWGDDGWELVTVVRNQTPLHYKDKYGTIKSRTPQLIYYFKRPL